MQTRKNRYDQLSKSSSAAGTKVASSPRSNGGTRSTSYSIRCRGGVERGKGKFKQGETRKDRIGNKKVHKDVVRKNDLGTINEDDEGSDDENVQFTQRIQELTFSNVNGESTI